ncbi:alpha-1,3-mannosyl-glycoprotein 4-beta-N-acetylglucosaminyltransferase C-like isoform X2 [Stylophora pistillata]|uniref:alpha-1,3-mannosyl-glycoprotein 4-beta-N-acetylglucosaminyltransferase C-like isoform X2 n=1 Tax=Stylophora pistillata TaxID=50429 RepID=UPI000C04C683|nr:alpha-1,3-mannosyl-glycoprotein 4-beta-N-acetylglucosaminyltransferase C-like isoform X2 [Stylophora pistillata]
MRWKAKLYLCQTRGNNSPSKTILLMITAGLMLHLNWRFQPSGVSMTCEVSCNVKDILSCSPLGKIITKTSVRELGKSLTRKVFLAIGIPTVERTHKNKTESYLTATLNSILTSGVSGDDLKDIIIVVFLADTEESARAIVKKKLLENFGKYLEMNLIHVISAPSSFYPRLKGIPSTFGDGPDRMYWRSKQSMDYVFMFYYSHGLANYYLHLEDDVRTEPNALSHIRKFIDQRGSDKWEVLSFSKWGFIGMLFHDDNLRLFGRYLEKFYSEMPCDWLLYNYYTSRGGKAIFRDKNVYEKALFHHIGHQSSSLGT